MCKARWYGDGGSRGRDVDLRANFVSTVLACFLLEQGKNDGRTS